MKTRVISVLVVISIPFLVCHGAEKDDRFQKLAADYIEQTLQTHPEEATALGDHRFDDRLTDYSPEARAKELAAAKAYSSSETFDLLKAS